jgi:large subunit ribosomal protein L4
VSTVTVVTPSGKGGADVELPGEIFEAGVNIPLMHQVVVAQEAAARRGTHATKTRGMVRGGGKKPYRQKGTGRARQGSLRAPQYAGGGTVHGPVPRSYAQRTPKKMKAAALRGALSDRMSHGRIAVVSAFVDGEEPSTKGAFAVLCTAVGVAGPRLRRPVLVVVTGEDELTRKSLRNVAGVRVLDSGQLNTYDVLASDHVVFTQAALGEFVTRATGEELTLVEPAAKPAPKPAAKPKKASAAGAGEAAEESGAEAAADAGQAEPAATKPAAKPTKASTSKAAAAEAAAAQAEVAEETDEPAAARAEAGEPAADEPAAGEPAKPAKAPSSRARKPKEPKEEQE